VRAKIGERFRLRDYVDIEGVDAFDADSVMARDLVDGGIRWTGKGVVIPFCDERGVVDLGENPKLSNYLYRHYAAVSGRYVATKSRDTWFRTIDCIYPELVSKPKLLVPEIEGEATFVFDKGE